MRLDASYSESRSIPKYISNASSQFLVYYSILRSHWPKFNFFCGKHERLQRRQGIIIGIREGVRVPSTQSTRALATIYIIGLGAQARWRIGNEFSLRPLQNHPRRHNGPTALATTQILPCLRLRLQTQPRSINATVA